MQIKIEPFNGTDLAEVISGQVVVRTAQDALNMMADASYQGCSGLILREENLHPDFFDLKTRLAGEILQKFSNYQMRLAIVGDFSKYPGKSLRDFIFESNRQGHCCFVGTVEEAKERLSK